MTLVKFSDLPKLPYDPPSKVMAAASKIKLALFDVDGVLTDGTLLIAKPASKPKHLMPWMVTG